MTAVSDQRSLLTEELDYPLPADLIAQTPLPDRSQSRLLVLDRGSHDLSHRLISDLPSLLRPGDLLVANNSRVIPARLYGTKRDTGGRVELLLLRRGRDQTWEALAKPARRLHPGTVVAISPRQVTDPIGSAEVVAMERGGEARIRLHPEVESNLELYGEVPLPPYIHELLGDPERYQTVYGSVAGSAAAPTAGLHFTQPMLERLESIGIGWAEVTLHVGLDTFRPVTEARLEDHRIHQEWCEVSEETAHQIAVTRRQGGRVVAVGTTAARTLETLGQQWRDDCQSGYSGMTGIFILPGYRWRLVDALLTNFHLPRSTLLAMVSALAGWERIRAAYQIAIAERYRFFSFGDAMLIL